MPVRPHTLKGLRIHEVSLVDAPANPGAMHVLFKRKDHATVDKRTDGPLERLLTRLGLRKSDTGSAGDDIDPANYADDAAKVVDTATDALSKSIASILADETVSDKSAAIAKSIGEFRGYVDEHTATLIETAMRDVAKVIEKEKPTMPTALEDATAAYEALKKQLDDATLELAKAKMSPEQAAAYKALSDEDKKRYAAADPEGRTAMLSKQASQPGDTQLAKALAETEDLKKRISSFEAERELRTFQKRASEIGLVEGHAETILKASKGDATAFDAVLDMIKAAHAQVRVGGVFKEFGGAGGPVMGGGVARAEVEAKAQELTKADPKLSMIAARVMVRKAHTELAMRERDEERAAVRAVS